MLVGIFQYRWLMEFFCDCNSKKPAEKEKASQGQTLSQCYPVQAWSGTSRRTPCQRFYRALGLNSAVGAYPVPKGLSKSRYSCNNYVLPNEFARGFSYSNIDRALVADLMQILCQVSSLGHFRNTFTASGAVVMGARESPDFGDLVLRSYKNPRM